MAWTFVGVSAAATATGTPLSLTEPAGVRDGDLLIACIASRTTSLTSINNSGWSLVAEQKTNNILTDTTAIASGAMFRRVREGVTDLTFTLPASGTSVCFGRMVAYRGVAHATPVDTSTAFTTATNTTAVSGAGLTTTQANDLIVAMCAGGQEAAWSAFDAVTDPSVASGATDTSTAPTAGTWIERADSITTTGADTSLAIFDAIKASAGATGNLTATASLGAGHVVIAGAFKISPASTADAWDISDKSPSVTLSNSDKTATATSLSYVRSTTKRANGTAGKYYAEFVANEVASGVRLGISNATADYTTANAFYATDGGIVQIDNVSSSVNLGAASDGDIFGVAWDAGAERVWFRRNSGLWNNDASADPATNTNGLDVSAHASVDHALWARLDVLTVSATVRTETAEFSYTGPSGFTSWMGEALGAATTDGVGDADGIGAASADGEATKQTSSVTTAGIGTAAAGGAATKETAGDAAGVGAATGSGASTVIVAGDASAVGGGTATAVGDVGSAHVAAAGTASGVGAAVGAGAQTAVVTGSAAGVGSATAVTSAAAIISGAGAASGLGSSSGAGVQTATTTAAAFGIGAATAAGGKTAAAAGTASGLGVATATGETTGEATATTGTASGIGAVNAISVAIGSTVGAASGIGAAVAATGQIAAAIGTASGIGTAHAIGTVFALVYLRPDGDSAAGGWTDQADGATNIVQSIDEADASDVDYVQSPQVVGTVANLKVRLFDGTTQIVEWTHADVSDEFADAVQTLTTPQVEVISNFSNLFVEFDDNLGNVFRFSLGNPPGQVAEPVKVRYRYKKLAA